MEVDYIVVGGGSAGCVLAYRLSEDPDNMVCLLEAGGTPLAKVSISGGGRCNVTHACFDPDVLTTYYPRGARELRGPFHHVRECVEILRGAQPDTPLNYKGRIFQVWGYKPAWATAAPPQIWIAANKPQMVAMATGLADGIMLGDMTPPRLAECMERVRAGLAAAGRDGVRVSSLAAWHVKADARASIAEAREQLALRGMIEDWYVDSFLEPDECRLVQAQLLAFFKAYKTRSPHIEGVPETILDKLVDNLTLSGDESSLDRHTPGCGRSPPTSHSGRS